MGKRRGDWSGEEQSHYLHQQQQISQEAMQQDYQHPHQPLPPSPNTSTWSNIVVKEETAEDKANDSGVSPGYSNSAGSPISHGSCSIRNGSVSPGSVNSGDSQQTPMNFECSTQNILNNSTSSGASISPTVAPQQPKTQEKAMDLGNRKKDSRKSDSDDVIIYTCPVCQFSSIQRLDFAEHLTAHYKNREGLDVLPVYNPNSRNQRASSSRVGRHNERSDPIGDFMDEPGVRTPKYNSQGKVKTYRCKQCAFVAITKLVFWAHSRVHLKSDKMLICPRCPFVTEYKHHLEYHLRNHYGSKPYQCEKCPYACVNRSMLTSHMKSHSNVYQYRCSDCNYLTKYCHSLKLHLRKYNHKPAMVLNPDGSPNPLPIIDVYGTRRGPKQKSAKSTVTSATKSTQQKSIASTSKGMPTVNQLAQLGALPLANGFNPLLAFNPFNPLFTGFPVVTPVPQLSPEQSQAIKANILAEYATAMAIERLNASKLAASNSRRDNSSPSELQQPLVNEITDHSMDVSSAPLDLSKPSPRRYENVAETQQKNHTIDIQHDGPLNLQRNATSDESTNYEVQLQKLSHVLDTVEPTTKTKNRRKGKAVKLNRKPVENDVAIPNGIKLNGLAPTDVVPNTITGEYKCTICDISFGNEVMYMVHIGYHGYQDVFTCNMCGQKCDDKVTFFLHIARANHT